MNATSAAHIGAYVLREVGSQRLFLDRETGRYRIFDSAPTALLWAETIRLLHDGEPFEVEVVELVPGSAAVPPPEVREEIARQARIAVAESRRMAATGDDDIRAGARRVREAL